MNPAVDCMPTDPDFLAVPPMLTLTTPRLRLRTVRVSDAAAIMPMITDAETMKFTSGVVANDLEAAERWLKARALGKDVLNFVITLREGGCKYGENEEGVIGGEKGEEVIVGIMGSYHWPEIGYLMHPGEFHTRYQLLLDHFCCCLPSTTSKGFLLLLPLL